MSNRLKRSPATISYELARCEPYQAEVAQTDAEYKRSRCGRKTKLNDKLRLRGSVAKFSKKSILV